jgi:hypothetical protein
MIPSIPIPNDHVVKFICLFSLAILIASGLGAAYLAVQFHEVEFKNLSNLVVLKANPSVAESG